MHIQRIYNNGPQIEFALTISKFPILDSARFDSSFLSITTTFTDEDLRKLLGEIFDNQERANGYVQEAYSGDGVEFKLPALKIGGYLDKLAGKLRI